MTERDLDVLCGVLMQMSMQKLLSLKKAKISWIRDLTEATQMDAVHSIRRALEAFRDFDFRTVNVSWLYCCLAERQVLRACASYRVTTTFIPAALRIGRFNLHEQLAQALQYPGGHTMCTAIRSGVVVYACVMATCPTDTSLEHDVICMCVSLPYLYVHAMTRCELRVIDAVRSVLRPNDCHFEKLGFPLTGDRNFCADLGAVFRRKVPGRKTGLGLETFDRKYQTVAEKPGQPSQEIHKPYAAANVVDLPTPPGSDNSPTGQDNPHFPNGNNVGVGPIVARNAGVVGEVSLELKRIFVCQDCNNFFYEGSIQMTETRLPCPSCGSERCNELV